MPTNMLKGAQNAGTLWQTFGQMLQVELALHEVPWPSSGITASAKPLLEGTLDLLKMPEAITGLDEAAWAELVHGLTLLVKEACGKHTLSPAMSRHFVVMGLAEPAASNWRQGRVLGRVGQVMCELCCRQIQECHK